LKDFATEVAEKRFLAAKYAKDANKTETDNAVLWLFLQLVFFAFFAYFAANVFSQIFSVFSVNSVVNSF